MIRIISCGYPNLFKIYEYSSRHANINNSQSFEDLCFLLGFNLNPLCLASNHPGKSGVDTGIIRKINQFYNSDILQVATAIAKFMRKKLTVSLKKDLLQSCNVLSAAVCFLYLSVDNLLFM